MVCGPKELKKLIEISGELRTVRHVICMDDDGVSTDILSATKIANWQVTSFAEVKTLGLKSPNNADLPVSTDTAVIMYTSGSTGLPKVCFAFIIFLICLFNQCDSSFLRNINQNVKEHLRIVSRWLATILHRDLP